ncbi:MAG: thermonuclease family protein, partial [Dehalococcoidia bacterium]|nr:thermonuclease family protein [Dehalococcoidia bacterium]
PDLVGNQCFAREAQRFTASLAPTGTTVVLERETIDRDRALRLLRYVYLPDGRLLNEVVVAEGVARFTDDPAENRFAPEMQLAERAAQAQRRGLWASCALAPTPTPTPSPTRPGEPTPTPVRCDPAYPDICLAPPPPTLTCADIPFRNFRVLPPDPHRFDADRNGVGCEQP